MSEPPVLVRISGDVAHLTLNRPHARNAITLDLARALHDGLRDAAERARVIVVRGAGVDVVIVRDDAVLADNHANLGMVPGGGGSQRLPRLVGVPRALGHMLLGERISGATAASWGLVHAAVPADEFESTVDGVVANLIGKDPAALARIKHLVRAGLRGPLTDGLAMETDTIITHLGEDRAGPDREDRT